MKLQQVLTRAALTAAIVGVAAPASAAELIGAASVTITNAYQTYLQVGEVVASQAGTGTDVALASNGASATALNNYGGSGGPGAAIDGNLSTDYFNPDGIYHSAGTPSDYLTVTFSHPDNLSSLTIYGRTDCCQNRDLYNVVIDNSVGGVLYSGQLDATTTPNGAVTVNFGGVPEPATWAFMLIGLGAVGAAMRRSRQGGGAVIAA